MYDERKGERNSGERAREREKEREREREREHKGEGGGKCTVSLLDVQRCRIE